MIAFLAIVGGIGLIILFQPPHSICDSQIEQIKKAQAKFLYKDPKSKQIKTTRYQRLRDECKGANNAGGCYELFAELKRMLHDLGTLNSECSGAVSGVAEIKTAINESVELMVQMAWGDTPPTSYQGKFNWMEIADVSLFCQLKARYINFYGEDAWNKERLRVSAALKDAEPMSPTQIWDMSLYSENCNRYP
jgi:hypothetical protein